MLCDPQMLVMRIEYPTKAVGCEVGSQSGDRAFGEGALRDLTPIPPLRPIRFAPRVMTPLQGYFATFPKREGGSAMRSFHFMRGRCMERTEGCAGSAGFQACFADSAREECYLWL